ncbi:MAG TPA: hypothetical protein PKJ36_04390, partial [Flavihumibacter sp.]|nr:hypothetical protein [Flavihumibacter sp.]
DLLADRYWKPEGITKAFLDRLSNCISTATSGPIRSEGYFATDDRYTLYFDIAKIQQEFADLSTQELFRQFDNLKTLGMLADISIPLKLADDLDASIDHFSDGLGVRKISLRRSPDTDHSYLVMKEELAAIKQKQDTVRLLGIIPHPPKHAEHKYSYGDRYYEFIFSLNNIEDLRQLQTSDITDRLRFYADNKNGKWKRNWKEGLSWKMAKDSSITGDRPAGGAYNTRDYFYLNLAVSLQNYKNYFATGFNITGNVVFSNHDRDWAHVISVGWEPLYLFANNQEGKLQTYRNEFVSIGYGQRPVEDKNPMKETSFTGIGSLGWLYHRQGEFMAKNSFRLSFGRFTWRKTHIDPLIYFHDFFRGTTPGLRIIQSF